MSPFRADPPPSPDRSGACRCARRPVFRDFPRFDAGTALALPSQAEPLGSRTTMNEHGKGRFSRRELIKSAAAAAAASGFAAISKPLYAANATPETTKAILGFIALTDSAPLIIAKEKGLFAKYGMPDVEVVKQASWGTTR